MIGHCCRCFGAMSGGNAPVNVRVGLTEFLGLLLGPEVTHNWGASGLRIGQHPNQTLPASRNALWNLDLRQKIHEYRQFLRSISAYSSWRARDNLQLDMLTELGIVNSMRFADRHEWRLCAMHQQHRAMHLCIVLTGAMSSKR